MRPRAALVLGTSANGDLLERLFEVGLTPVVRSTMERALDALRRDQFAAVVVDRTAADVDTLEFILNARDVDESTAVFVLGERVESSTFKALLANRKTTPVSGLEELAAVLQAAPGGKTRAACRTGRSTDSTREADG